MDQKFSNNYKILLIFADSSNLGYFERSNLNIFVHVHMVLTQIGQKFTFYSFDLSCIQWTNFCVKITNNLFGPNTNNYIPISNKPGTLPTKPHHLRMVPVQYLGRYGTGYGIASNSRK